MLTRSTAAYRWSDTHVHKVETKLYEGSDKRLDVLLWGVWGVSVCALNTHS